MNNVTAVILAAGESTRMKSELSKLLHRLGHRYLIEFPVQACVDAQIERIILVVGHQAAKIESVLGMQCEYVYQKKRLGTGDALKQATSLLGKDARGELVVLPGDAPFVGSQLIRDLILHHRRRKPAATVLTAELPDPGSYGRVVRDGYRSIKKIVESKNATEQELQIKEINSSVYCFDTQKIVTALPLLRPDKLSGEIYLTDAIEILYQQGEKVEAFTAPDPRVAIGVNTPEDLEKAYHFLENEKPIK